MLLNLLYFCVLGESGLLLWKLDDNGKMTNYAKLHDWKFGSSTWVIDKGYIFEKSGFSFKVRSKKIFARTLTVCTGSEMLLIDHSGYFLRHETHATR